MTIFFPNDLLEPRFLPPENWKQQYFKNLETNHKISISTLLSPQNVQNLIILPGLSEFGEKYIETARFFFKNGFNIYVIDWAYQGRSTRYKQNPHKRHSDGYDKDLSDLHYLIDNFVETNQPSFFIGHSMGGHLGLRYLAEYKHNIKAAAFSAPMLKIKSLKLSEKFYHKILRTIPFITSRYVPGGKDWNEENRNLVNKDIFSSDPVRKKLHNLWSKYVPILQLGNPTLKWVQETLKSILILNNEYQHIKTPIFIAAGGSEKLVDNKEIKRAVKILPQAHLRIIPKSKHEIMMETDDIRDEFLSQSLKLFRKNA